MLAFIKDELNRDAALRVAKGLGACAFGIVIASLFAQTTLFDRLSSWLYDSLQRSMGRTTDLDNVLVLDVDEESLRRMAQPVGTWRTDREVYAGVVRYLEAHGARAIAFTWLILRRGLALAAAGIAIGVTASLAVSGVMRSLLFQVSPTDLSAFGGASAVLALVAVAACLLPAWRAGRLDPVVTLRRE